jgi:hypothetical protein
MSQSVYPPDYSTPVGQLRALVGDEEQYAEYSTNSTPAYMFSDDKLQALLAINRDKLKYAAADLIDQLATNEALVSKKIRTEDLQTDGASVANALRLHAQNLRTDQKREDAEDDAEFAFEIVDFVPQPANWPWR